MPALARLVGHQPRKPLSRYEYYLPLSDVLMVLAKSSTDAGAKHYEELAESFANDVLNLANLAARLLWHEGVSPDIWRSPDIITVSVDTESYFVMLQSACDVMADVIATLGAQKKGQVPSESFHRLNNWARENSNRLRSQYREIASSKLWWFDEINGVRTKLVHRGGHIWIYTERVSFIWSVHPPEKTKTRRTSNRLLEALRTLTSSMLKFSAKLAHVIGRERGLSRLPRGHVLSGVFVPGLHHLLREYTQPQGSARNTLNAKCLAVCGDYPAAASFGYPSGFWWHLLLELSELIGAPLLASMPVNAGGQVHDYAVVFQRPERRCGIVACEQMIFGDKWVREAATAIEKHAKEYVLDSAVLVACRRKDEGFTGEVPFQFVLSDVPTEAAQKIVKLWGLSS
jgi:hypothetical protein